MMGDKTFKTGAKSEQVKEFLDTIRAKVKECEYYKDGCFENEPTKQYIPVKFFKISVIRIWEKKDKLSLEIKENYIDLFRLRGKAVFRKSDLLWGKVPFDVDTTSAILQNIKLVFEQCYLEETVEPFGCCSRYVECSDNKSCTHPDKKLAKGCVYKTNLDMGRIFYGKNRNT